MKPTGHKQLDKGLRKLRAALGKLDGTVPDTVDACVRVLLLLLRSGYAIEFARFVTKLQVNRGCLVWTGKREGAYGGLRFRGNTHGRAHVVSFLMFRGDLSIDKPLVCHTCDRPLCVWPGHLFIGTNADNMADRDRKGRQASGARNGMVLYPDRRPRIYGERNGSARLSDLQRAEIRRRYSSGTDSMRALGQSFGVEASTIWRVVHGGAS